MKRRLKLLAYDGAIFGVIYTSAPVTLTEALVITAALVCVWNLIGAGLEIRVWNLIGAGLEIRVDSVSPETARRLRTELAQDQDIPVPTGRRRPKPEPPRRARLLAFSKPWGDRHR